MHLYEQNLRRLMLNHPEAYTRIKLSQLQQEVVLFVSKSESVLSTAVAKYLDRSLPQTNELLRTCCEKGYLIKLTPDYNRRGSYEYKINPDIIN